MKCANSIGVKFRPSLCEQSCDLGRPLVSGAAAGTRNAGKRKRGPGAEDGRERQFAEGAYDAESTEDTFSGGEEGGGEEEEEEEGEEEEDEAAAAGRRVEEMTDLCEKLPGRVLGKHKQLMVSGARMAA